MANVIQIKRGNGTPSSGTLADGELGFDKTNNILYIGKNSNIVALDYVKKSGDTMTGNLSISPSGNGQFTAYDGNHNGFIWVGFASLHQNHGLWSDGYASNSTTWVKDEKWMIYRNSSGEVIVRGNAETATKATQDGDGNTISSTYLKTSGGTLTGNLILSKSTTIANNYPAMIDFSVTQTNNNITSHGYIRVYDDHDTSSGGTNIVIHGGGNMFIGSGESPYNLYSNVFSSTTGGEDLYLLSDGTAYVYANADTYGNRIGYAITTTGNIIPQKAEAANDNAQSLGVSDNRWSKLYVGSANSYGSTSLPVYWNAGVPSGVTSLSIPGNIYTSTSSESERQVGVKGGAGDLFLYSVASSTGNRGLWASAHGTGSGKAVIKIDTNNVVTFAGNIDQLYYGTSAPSSPRTGHIWLKPI